jgi:glucose/mannose-6-phosphate isomerase
LREAKRDPVVVSPERIREVDPGGQLDDVLALPEHLRDALWRVESAGLEPTEASGLIVCGMGGSAIGAMLARAAMGDALNQPMQVFRDYELPPWTNPDRAVLCSSYSGETEETLACFEAAEAVGARRYVATTGGALADAARAAGVPVIGLPSGLQPRHAVGYGFTVACEIAALVGVASGMRTEIDTAAAHLEEGSERLVATAAELADRIKGTVPAIYGCDATVPVAYRWKCEINENAKQHAFSHQLPELDHNEIVGWSGNPSASGFSAIFLTDRDQHPRLHERAELTAQLIEPRAAAVEIVETEGETRVERLLWGVMLGDLVSLNLAAHNGVDPTPVDVIDRLKQELGRSGD